jgi:SNF2 family DNA or RNA helicase
MKMRLGKTLCTIRFIKMKNLNNILVFAPYSALQGWHDALEEEGQKEIVPLYQIKPSLRNSTLSMFHTCKSKNKWWLCNKESFLYVAYATKKWDAIILDESFIKNPKSKATKFFLKYFKESIRLLLTGTPAPENELQYYTQLEFLFPGIFGVKNFWEYRAKFARPSGFHGFELNPRGKIQLAEILSKKCFVLNYNDVNLLIPPVYETRFVKLDPETRKKYLFAEKNCLVEADMKVLKYAGQKWAFMRRLITQKEKEHDLLELLNGELKNNSVVIGCNYVEEVERIADLLDTVYIHGSVDKCLREKVRSAFNAGDYTRIVIQPETQKWGSDYGTADTLLILSSPQSKDTREQFEKRIVNLDRKYPDLIIDLVAEDTVEIDILESLKAKENQIQMTERMRRSMQRRQAA